ncbi:MAG TPA: hypothetical protein PLN96_08500 [Zoogloea sp.]|uniref:hypothetical protein n=1 Tax=Zoogloea sp. TaxID=49181 RepID=UPI002BF1AB53|nr:hypothetical protein [Zoogloea sp.]HMV17389.1 hypothetical protein [Rhodocyclaceae bacterium]HMV63551.1 hypothetical protein [Rhodocyclaceae bacterium]HMW52047.1 hypothetical protein [Rhodocyclaceae bacterium]HMZ76416.1 hypothetical protein [Rhodocyclaceae bacterium]HNA67902.1 hypothetical protein [Rhodocyclaceae bacterium]
MITGKGAFCALMFSAGILSAPAATADEGPRLSGSPKVEFTDSTAERIGQTRRVAITNVILEFQTKVFAEHITGRLSKMYLKRGDSFSDNELAGFDPRQLEQAANQVYKKLVTDLTAAGFEVVPEAQVLAQPAYQKLRETMGWPQGYHFGNKEGHSLIVGPTALKPYVPPLSEQGTFANTRQEKGELQAPALGWSDRARFAGNSSYAAGLEVQLAKALNAHVVKVWYLIGFGNATASTDWDAISTAHFSTTATSRTGATAQMYLRDEETRLAVRLPDGDAGYARESKRINAITGGYRPYDGDVVVRLDETIPGEADFLAGGGVQNATTERDAKAGIGGLLGSMAKSLTGTIADNSYKTTVDPTRFAAAAADMAGQLQPFLIARIKR